MPRHPEEEALAALALGDGTPDDAVHVDGCSTCRAEVDAYVDAMARAVGAGPVTLVAPPARVWEAIQDELSEDQGSPGASPQTVSATVGAAPTLEGSGSGSGAGAADELAARRARRMPRWAFAANAAAAGVVVGAFGVSLLGGAEPGLQGTVVATAPLAALADDAPAGTAEVVQREDGTEVLVIDTDTASVTDAYLEVWLIDTSVEGMISLGPLTGGHAELEIPAGFDVASFPIVDISVEPLDGVPTHSGDSVTRGVLGAQA